MQQASFARGLGVAGLGKTEEVFHLQQETSAASPCSWGRSLMVQETKTPTGPYPLGTLPPPQKKKSQAFSADVWESLPIKIISSTLNSTGPGHCHHLGVWPLERRDRVAVGKGNIGKVREFFLPPPRLGLECLV